MRITIKGATLREVLNAVAACVPSATVRSAVRANRAWTVVVEVLHD